MVYLPAIATHQYNTWILEDPEYSLLITFISFTLVSVAGYIFNDLADFERDRKNPLKKKNKPIANGNIDKQVASFWLAVFLIGGLTLTQKFLNTETMMWEIAFFATGAFYSLFLNRFGYIGLFIMSIASVFRVLAGAATMEINALAWWLAFAAIINLAINFAVKAKQDKKLKQIESPL